MMVRESDMFPQRHVLLPVGQEFCDPPAGGVGSRAGMIVLKKEPKSRKRILA